MAIAITCTNCGGSLRAAERNVGRKVKCPKCGAVLPVPAGDEDEVADAAGRGARTDDDPQRPRCRRNDDGDNDDSREPRRRRSPRAAAKASTAALGLGVASLSIGVLGLAMSWIPIVGPLVCGTGLVLGIVAVILAIRKGRGYGMPVAGSALSSAALVVSMIVTFVLPSAANNAAQQLERAAGQAPGAEVKSAKWLAGAPWYLLAAGIFIVILGYFSARLSGGSRIYISPKMSDEEIERLMSKAHGNPLAGLLVMLGFLMVFVSIVWRLVRLFVS